MSSYSAKQKEAWLLFVPAVSGDELVWVSSWKIKLVLNHCCRCEGKSRCVLTANSDQLVDACPGTSKYLQVTYECGINTGAHIILYMFEDQSLRIRMPYFVKIVPIVVEI